MSSGFDEISLAVFTTLAPAGAVAFMLLAVARVLSRDDAEAQRIDRMMAIPFAIVLLGFVVSATHLGTPANALYVLLGMGRSPLSNEVLAAAAFMGLAGMYWMASFSPRFATWLARVWLVAACAAGAVFLWFTSWAYSVPTVPTWNTPWTPVALVAQACAGGCMMALPLLRLAKAHRPKLEVALIAASAVFMAANAFVWMRYGEAVAGIANNEFTAMSLIPHFQGSLVSYVVVGLVALAMACASCAFSARMGDTSAIGEAGSSVLVSDEARACWKNFTPLALSVASCVIMLLATFLLRWGFYQLHMTVGF